MIDILYIRDKVEHLRTALSRRCSDLDVGAIVTLDAEWRQLLQQTQEFEHLRKIRSKEIGAAMKSGGDADALKAVVKTLNADLKKAETALRECEERGTFCLEIALRAQLRDRGGTRVVNDVVALYSNPTRRGQNYFIHSNLTRVLVMPHSPCRDLKRYCGAAGRKLFRRDLMRALDVLVARVLPHRQGAK